MKPSHKASVANLVIWPSLFEKHRRVVLGANMLAVEGYIQREGLVVHIVAKSLIDLSVRLAGIGDQERFPLPHGRGDKFHHGSAGSPDSRDRAARKPRDIYVPDLHMETLKLKPRNFR